MFAIIIGSQPFQGIYYCRVFCFFSCFLGLGWVGCGACLGERREEKRREEKVGVKEV